MKRKKNIIKAKDALRQKLKYHAEDSLKDENTEKAMSIQFKKVIRFLKSSNKKRCIINTLSRLKEFINRILNEEDEQSELNQNIQMLLSSQKHIMKESKK